MWASELKTWQDLAKKKIAVQDRPMANQGEKGGTEDKSAAGSGDRPSRESKSLRDNLRRRKQQARQRAEKDDGVAAAKKIRPY